MYENERKSEDKFDVFLISDWELIIKVVISQSVVQTLALVRKIHRFWKL